MDRASNSLRGEGEQHRGRGNKAAEVVYLKEIRRMMQEKRKLYSRRQYTESRGYTE